MNGGDAAHALGRVFREGDRLAGFLGRLDERDHDRLGAGIEHPLHEHLIVPGETDDRIGRRAADGAQDVSEVRHLDRHMLHIHHEEVEAAVAHRLGRRGRCRHEPGAERRARALTLQPSLEAVLDVDHGVPLED